MDEILQGDVMSIRKNVEEEFHEKNDTLSLSKLPHSSEIQLTSLQLSILKESSTLDDKTKESYENSKSLISVHIPSDKQLPDSNVVETLVPAVVIPTGSTSSPSPQIEESLSKDNQECAPSYDTSFTQTGIKIINSTHNCEHCKLQTRSTNGFLQHLFKKHIKKRTIKSKNKQIFSQKLKIYFCLYCDFQVKLQKLLRWHILEHFRFRCSQCALECTNIESLHEHLREHDDDKVKCDVKIKCSRCSYKGKKRSLERHMKKHADKNQVVVCRKCKEKFLKNYLNTHLERVHKIHLIKCLDCNSKFLTEKKLEIHYKKSHLGFSFMKLPDPEVKRICTKILSCSNCNFKTKNERDFKFHQLKEHFFDNVKRNLKWEKLKKIYSKEEKLEYLWCYIYATNKNLKKKNLWNIIQTIIDERGIAESVKLEFLTEQWRLNLLNEWKSLFVSNVKSFEKQVDKYILSSSKNDAKNLKKFVSPKICDRDVALKYTVEDLLEVLYCYLFSFHKVFPTSCGRDKMRRLLNERGILNATKLKYKTNKAFVYTALKILNGKTQITVEQIEDMKKKIDEILLSDRKSEDGDSSNVLSKNSDDECVSSKRVVERDQDDTDMDFERNYKTEQFEELEPVFPDCFRTKNNIGENTGPDVKEAVTLIVNASDSEAKVSEPSTKEESSDIDMELETLDEQVEEWEPVSSDCFRTKSNIGEFTGPDVKEAVTLIANASDSEAKVSEPYTKEEASDIDMKLETLDDIDMKLETLDDKDLNIETLDDISQETMKLTNLTSSQLITETKSDDLEALADTSEGTIEIIDQIMTKTEDIEKKEEDLL